ncbi:MAG: hypothetical protein HQK93_09280 [Nitrospirae bacterium]|nr:hypothetical protein [Nitrospirota bacterium]
MKMIIHFPDSLIGTKSGCLEYMAFSRVVRKHLKNIEKKSGLVKFSLITSFSESESLVSKITTLVVFSYGLRPANPPRSNEKIIIDDIRNIPALTGLSPYPLESQ